MLVAVDKFAKWVEAAPVTTQDSTVAINFIRDFYFRALRSLVVLSFPQPLNFSSVFPSL
jgi:hypothetical protein